MPGKLPLWERITSTASHSWKRGKHGSGNFIRFNINIYFYRYSDDLELEDAIHTAILTLKEGFEGQMTADNIEIGISDKKGFRRLKPSEVRDYLASI